jgi:hypothetical protein
VAAPPPEAELRSLQSQADYITGALDDIKKRIKELEAGEEEQ